MKRLMLALLSLSIVPASASAAAPKTISGQIAVALRKAHPDIKGIAARNIKERYLNGAVGGFTVQGAYRAPAKGNLYATPLSVSGDFNAKVKPMKITDVKIGPLKIRQ